VQCSHTGDIIWNYILLYGNRYTGIEKTGRGGEREIDMERGERRRKRREREERRIRRETQWMSDSYQGCLACRG
jgi:hypothetical protein